MYDVWCFSNCTNLRKIDGLREDFGRVLFLQLIQGGAEKHQGWGQLQLQRSLVDFHLNNDDVNTEGRRGGEEIHGHAVKGSSQSIFTCSFVYNTQFLRSKVMYLNCLFMLIFRYSLIRKWQLTSKPHWKKSCKNTINYNDSLSQALHCNAPLLSLASLSCGSAPPTVWLSQGLASTSASTEAPLWQHTASHQAPSGHKGTKKSALKCIIVKLTMHCII